jgi:regulator of ribosome biosynthesis
MAWDEDKKEYKPAWGYGRANDETTSWALEAAPGDDGSVDPWTLKVKDPS